MRIYCSGIGGIGLSAYASHMKALGHDVSGSDRSKSATTDDLESQGIKVFFNQDGSHLPQELDLLVYSEAIPANAPERTIPKQRGVKELSYFHALGELTNGKQVINVCGTHGKSSTTAMVAKILMNARRDPNIVVGTKMNELSGRNWRKGENDLWIVEACEYRRSFLFLKPSIILITNADGDHFDAFKDQNDYDNAFLEFFASLPEDGVIIAHGKDAHAMKLIKKSGKKIIDADALVEPKLAVPGEHMRQNARLALALAIHLGIDEQIARESLEGFGGTWRRMEVKGTTQDGVTVIDDYGHHPTEIKATLAAMREAYPKRRIVTVFQPHTHDRTRTLWNDFASSFKDADVAIITDIYDARPDTEKGSADPKKLASDIAKQSGIESIYVGDLKKAEDLLHRGMLRKNDVLVVMGAGSVTSLASAMMR